jgi:drug/metabolite transporter (DMT)-like permease
MFFSIGLIVAIWAVNFLAAKIGLRHLPPLAMASFRVVIAGAAMLPAYLLCRRLTSFVEAREAQRRGFSARDYWTFGYLGFFGVTVNQVCFTVGLRYTSVGHASVIIGTGPVYILVLAVLMRLERWTWRKASGMAIGLSGVSLLAAKSGMSTHSPTLLGDFITLCGSLGFAMYAVLGKRVAGKYDALTMTAYNHFAGALIVLPLAIHQALRIGPADKWRAIPWESWAATAYMALFGSAVAYILYFWLLRYMAASQVSAFTYLLPVTATVLGIVFLGEPVSPGQIAGGALALAGVYWIESGRASDAPPPA